jgi:hypothetical protein
VVWQAPQVTPNRRENAGTAATLRKQQKGMAKRTTAKIMIGNTDLRMKPLSQHH